MSLRIEELYKYLSSRDNIHQPERRLLLPFLSSLGKQCYVT